MKRSGRSLLFALATLVLAACAEPVAPAVREIPSDGPVLTASHEPDLRRLATFRGKRGNGPHQMKGWIGPAGGRLELRGFAIDIPAGAVDRPTKFSISLPRDPHAADHVMVEFGPHGAEFARPVTIEMPYAGTSLEGSAGSVLWWDAKTRAWVDMGSALTPDGLRLRTVTGRFSLFGAGTVRRSGGVTVSGG